MEQQVSGRLKTHCVLFGIQLQLRGQTRIQRETSRHENNEGTECVTDRLYNNTTNISDLIRVTTQSKHLKGLPDLTCNFILLSLLPVPRRNHPAVPSLDTLKLLRRMNAMHFDCADENITFCDVERRYVIFFEELTMHKAETIKKIQIEYVSLREVGATRTVLILVIEFFRIINSQNIK